MQREFPEIPLVGVGAIIIETASFVKRPPAAAGPVVPEASLKSANWPRPPSARLVKKPDSRRVGRLARVYDRVLRNAEERACNITMY
jgi:hypothetical protein